MNQRVHARWTANFARFFPDGAVIEKRLPGVALEDQDVYYAPTITVVDTDGDWPILQWFDLESHHNHLATLRWYSVVSNDEPGAIMRIRTDAGVYVVSGRLTPTLRERFARARERLAL